MQPALATLIFVAVLFGVTAEQFHIEWMYGLCFFIAGMLFMLGFKKPPTGL